MPKLDPEQYDEVPTPPMTAPEPRALTPVQLMARAAELRLNGASMMDVARKLAIPYPAAVKLCGEIDGGVVREIASRYTPEVQATLKAEISDALVEEVAVCRRKGRKNLRAYTPMNSAAKQLSQMYGMNAPTRTVNVEWKAHSMVNPEVHARIMADPVARAALIQLEEFAAGHQDDIGVAPRPTPEGGGD